jgi:putative ABC transport system permease protein
MRFKHVLRRLRQSPMFTTVTVITLALGIGANAAIFSVLEGILLKPLAYPDPDRLIAVDHAAPGVNLTSAGIAPFLYFTYRDQNQTFQDIGMWTGDNLAVTGLAEPEVVPGIDLTDGVLPLLGARPALGRLFSRHDDSPGSPRTVIISYQYWQSRFGGNPSVIGRGIVLDGRPTEIIGVLPAAFQFLDRKADLFLPMQRDRAKVFLGNFSYQSLARLKPGVTTTRANADLTRMIPIALRSYPPFPGGSVKMFESARLAPNLRLLKQDLIGDIGKLLWVLMGTIGIVLLIACANVANLLLVRTEGRLHELAIRLALGASWGQIARALIVESLLLGALGGAAGLGLAFGAVRLLTAIAPSNLPRLNEISIDGNVLLFTLAVSLLAGALFGAIPIFKCAGPHLATALRAGGRAQSQSRERHRVRNMLVVVQVGLAMLLLIGSGLMIRTFQTLRNVQPGFTRPEEIQTLRIFIPETQVKDPVQVLRMQQNILEKIAALPGVSSVAFTSKVPLDLGGWHDPIYAQDHVYTESQIPPLRSFKMISPGLLKTLGNSLIAGRDFSWTDLYEKRLVALLSENLARELWHDPQAAIGKRVRDGARSPWREVVGVVSDERDDGVDHKAPTIVLFPTLMDNFGGNQPFIQRSVALVVRSPRTGSSAFLNEVSRAVWSVNPNLPLANVRTLAEVYRKSLARTSFTLVMLAIAGGMALLLGVIGIYGVISYSVLQRTREIGIRMALGSPRQDVTRLFVGHGLKLAAIGIACGLAAAAVCTRLMSSLLFEVSPLDPLTFAGVPLMLVLAAALASYVPAVRAALVDPVEALRTD